MEDSCAIIKDQRPIQTRGPVMLLMTKKVANHGEETLDTGKSFKQNLNSLF